MRRSAIVTLSLAIAATLLLAAVPPDPVKALAEGKKLFAEKSWKLANAEFDKVMASDAATTAARREAKYLKAGSDGEMNSRGNATAGYKDLTDDKADDIWAGRAHWRLASALANGWMWEDEASTSIIRHLRAAEEILVRLKADDLADFQCDVALRIAGRANLGEIAQRAYVYSAIEKALALVKDTNRIAELQLQRAMLTGWVESKPWTADLGEKKLAALRQVVSEFPETPSASKAQLAIAADYFGADDRVAALREYEKVVKRWPDSPEAKAAAEQARAIREEQVYFVLGTGYLPGEPVKFELRGRNVKEISVTATPFDPAAAMRKQRTPKLDLKEVGGESAQSWTYSLPARTDYQPTTTPVELKIDKPGAYVLRASAGKANAYGLLLVTEIMLVGNNGTAGFEFWVVDAKTGQPRQGARVDLGSNIASRTNPLTHRNYSEFSKLRNDDTDENGFVTFKTEGDNGGGQYLAVASTPGGNHAFFDSGNWRGRQTREDAEQLFYIYTDRPVYRPGQQVSWRAIAAARTKGKVEPEPDKKYTVRIFDPQGAKVFEKLGMKANEFGALSGDIKLGPRPPLGQYAIWVSEDNKPGRNGSFRVEEYKKPEYEVKVSTADKMLKSGSRVKADIEARYMFGAPVSDADVRYSVKRRKKYFIQPYFAAAADTDLGWFDAAPPDQGPRHGTGGDIVSNGTGKTDAQGKFRIEFDAEVPPEPPAGPGWRGGWWWRPEVNACDFQIEATVTDKSRRNIDGTSVIVVGDKALQVSVAPRNNLYSPGDMVRAEVATKNLGGEPVPTSATLYVERVVWDEDAQKEKVTTVSTQRIDTAPSATITAEWRVPADEAGRMRFLVQADDPFGGKSQAYGWFTVAGPDTKDIHTKYQGAEILTDKNIYAVDDAARVMITTQFPGASAWFWIDSGSGNLEKKLVPLPNRTNFVSVPITEGFVPNSKIHVVVVRDKTVFTDEKELIVPPQRRVLRVEVVPDKETYKPGADGTVTLKASDHAGKPVRAEFSLAMFDRSILYIAPDSREDIRRFFYGTRRDVQSSLDNSQNEPGSYNSLDPQVNTGLLMDRQYSTRYHLGGSRAGRALGGFALGDSNGDFGLNYSFDEAGATKLAMPAAAAMPAAPAPRMAASMDLALEGTVSNGDVYRVRQEARTRKSPLQRRKPRRWWPRLCAPTSATRCSGRPRWSPATTAPRASP